MNVILMREERDCHNAAIGTACQVTYEQASRATGHINLPGPFESPIISNPWNLYRALINLGFWKRNIVLHDILTCNYEHDKTIVLLHAPNDPYLSQHWIVLSTCDVFGFYKAYFGDKTEPRFIRRDDFSQMFLAGQPKCAFQVYKANFWELIKARILSWFN